ncbi:MAG: response regulator [Patescibacteria group bacterium]
MSDSQNFILIVEDDEAFSEMLSWVFFEEGFLIETACNLKEARRALETNKNIFLVLSDVELPGEKGFQLDSLCRNLEVPLIFMSGLPFYQEEAESLGREFLSKNSDYKVFLETVKFFL